MATAEVPLRLATLSCDVDSSKDTRFLFDDSSVEQMVFVGRLPANFASALVAKIQYAMASANSGKVDKEVSVMAVTDGDAQDLDADSYDTPNAGNETVPGTAGHMSEISIALTNADGAAAGDYLRIKLERDADDATDDTATGDCELRNFVVEYTTS